MNGAFDLALYSARFWRDLGTDILIVFLVIEVLLEVWEPKDKWSPWHSKARKYSRNARLFKYVPSKQKLAIIAALAVALGVGLEKWQGTKADEIADKIRVGLEDEILTLMPWSRRLPFWVAESLSPKLKPFAGQRIAIIVELPPNSSHPEADIQWFALELAKLFDDSDWRNSTGEHFLVPDPRMPGQQTYEGILYVPTQTRFDGEVETDAQAPARVKAASSALGYLLAGDLFINLPFISEHASSLPDSLRLDKNLIVIFLKKEDVP